MAVFYAKKINLDACEGITMPQQEYDFFISFSNTDLNEVSSIVRLMEEEYGAKCWFQEKDSKAEFIDAIMDGIESSKAFVLFISPSSANSYFVLNEVNHAVECRQNNNKYEILPIVLNSCGYDLNDPTFKKIKFYLGRLNMLFMSKFESQEALVLKIFDQTGYEIRNEKLHDSLYHTSESEAKRLQAQNEILRNFSHEYFQNTVKPEYNILDVGCADGSNIILRLNGLEYNHLLGVDIDEGQVALANENYGGDKNTFVACDITDDAFNDLLADYLEDIDVMGFDLIHISAVFMHLSEPVKLLRILKRFLKKTGYLFIQDEDDGANLVYPNYKFFDRAFAIWADSKESGDRHCARKIPSYLAEAGFKRNSLVKCGVSNVGMDEKSCMALWDIYFNYHLWLALDENMFYHKIDTYRLLDEYKNEYDKYKKEYDEGKIFLQLGFVFFVAQK